MPFVLWHSYYFNSKRNRREFYAGQKVKTGKGYSVNSVETMFYMLYYIDEEGWSPLSTQDPSIF